jgi:hypothetical protein
MAETMVQPRAAPVVVDQQRVEQLVLPLVEQLVLPRADRTINWCCCGSDNGWSHVWDSGT